jgi:hypothetical protein
MPDGLPAYLIAVPTAVKRFVSTGEVDSDATYPQLEQVL